MIILEVLGCLAVVAVGGIVAFGGALGNEAPVYILGIVIGIAGVVLTCWTLFSFFS